MQEESISTITRYSVFVPGDFPLHSYVRRKFWKERIQESFDPESEISDALKQRGMIAQVVGPSKSGKTRAIENCVGTQNLVSIAGSQITPDTTLWAVVARQLRIPTSGTNGQEKGNTVGLEADANISTELPLANAEVSISGNLEHSTTNLETFNVEFDSFQNVVTALQQHKKVLFLDDFHTIPHSSQSHVAAQLKAAAQLGLKICLAEVPHHSDKTISALPDLTARIKKIEFQYWTVDDLIQIGDLGFDKLNVTVSRAALQAFAMEAAGSPQLMQLLCLNAAACAKIENWEINRKTQQFTLTAMRQVFLKTHETVDRDRIFKIIDKGPDERGNQRNRYPVRQLGSGDNYEIALAAISLSPPSTSLDWNSGEDNIAKRIDDVCTDQNNKPQRSQITRALEQMQALAEKHMPNQPIIEWDSTTGLQILDPYFLFHLRWTEKYEKIRNEPSEKESSPTKT